MTLSDRELELAEDDEIALFDKESNQRAFIDTLDDEGGYVFYGDGEPHYMSREAIRTHHRRAEQ